MAVTWLWYASAIAAGVGAGIAIGGVSLVSLARLDGWVRGWARRGRALPRFRAWVRAWE